jgi:hypothetical protein
MRETMRPPIWRVLAAGLVGGVLGTTSAALAAEEAKAGLTPLVAAVHVHSTASTGSLSLDALAERAERLGLDVVILTDNFALEYEYGLSPVDGVLKRTVGLPSVLRYGLARYLNEIAAVQARHPRVLLIPGVEVAPHYYWTGSLWRGDLTMHDAQKNLLVIGLADPQGYATLPAIGNPASYHYDERTALSLAPAVLFVPAVWLWRGRLSVAGRRGRPACGWTVRRTWALLLTGAALLLLVNAWPFSRPAFSAYDARLGYRPYQALIDAVNERGGLIFWSMPEARDFRTFSFGWLGKVIIQTDPHPEALMLTQGYAGFGGLYQEARTVTDPGGLWDQLIHLYASGQRTTPPALVGEIAFHGPDHAGKELDQVATVLWVSERTVAGVLDALRRGRSYAVERYRKEFGYRLDDFRVEVQGGVRTAGPGEILDPEGARDVVVRLSVSATDHGRHPLTARIVRSGQVVARMEGWTPFAYAFVDATAPAGTWLAYRVQVVGEGEILSNPVYVGPLPKEKL